MRLLAVFLAAAALLGCGGPKPHEPVVSRDPISVRGWIADVDTGAPPGNFRTVETESARRAALFQSMNVWVDNAPYVSGGITENGSFILLDVPSGNVKISFSAPGVPVANLDLQNIPANADLLLPALVIRPAGVTAADPAKLKVRVAAKISKAVVTAQKATIAGQQVAVVQVPINDMVDRRDYPVAPSNAPLATVK